MARLPRYTIINQPQNIVLPVKPGTAAFRDDEDYQYFHDCLDAAAYNYRLKVHAYALTPSEVFLLASPGREDSASRTMQSIGRNYVQYYNETYGSIGGIVILLLWLFITAFVVLLGAEIHAQAETDALHPAD